MGKRNLELNGKRQSWLIDIGTFFLEKDQNLLINHFIVYYQDLSVFSRLNRF